MPCGIKKQGRKKMKDIKDIRVACVGCGVMGGALVRAMAKVVGADRITVSAASYGEAFSFAEKTGVRAAKTNTDAVSGADFVFLAVKPAYIRDVLSEIRPFVRKDAVYVSMAAGVTLKTIGELRAVRIMPNIPATVGEGMVALCSTEGVSSDDLSLVKTLLSESGRVDEIPERLMDGVTAVSGSGPAYAFLFIEALADAAVRFGMPRKQAYVYAAQTLKGAAELFLNDGRSVSELKDAVCSPAGTTIEGVIALEESGFRAAVINAATAAFEKSVELGQK